MSHASTTSSSSPVSNSTSTPSSRSPPAISLAISILSRQPITPPSHVILHQLDVHPLLVNTHPIVTVGI
ncbi:hypothetical protein U1Q18_026011, partial [Sarracenia purpurea var. burkii]